MSLQIRVESFHCVFSEQNDPLDSEYLVKTGAQDIETTSIIAV